MRTVKMLDLQAEFKLFEADIRRAIDQVLEDQQFIGGPAIAELEQAVASRLQVGHAVAVSSGTDAILCALMALGIGQGDEVIVPAFTFFATGGCVVRVGARPVFVDVDPETFNMDPDSARASVSRRTRAIIPVHLFGQCAPMTELADLAKEHGLRIIEDAAQAIGATYHGRSAGGMGDLGCLSFYPTKNLGGFGEGGMIVTSDEDLAAKCRLLRTHGESGRYIHDVVGGNFRLDTMKAAILLVKLGRLDAFIARRREIAARYDERLGSAGVSVPRVAPGGHHVYHQYSILSDRRDELVRGLSDHGIGSGVYYPVPLHRQRCFNAPGTTPPSLPVAESLSRRILSLPCHPMMTDDDVDYVARQVIAFQESGIRPGSVAPVTGWKAATTPAPRPVPDRPAAPTTERPSERRPGPCVR